MKSTATILATLMLPCIALGADKPAKFKIQIVDNSSDSIGQRLVYELKEKIRASQSMELTSNCDNGCWRIIVLSVDKENQNEALKGFATVFSVIWIGVADFPKGTPLFLDSTIGYCGGQRVKETAEDIVAHTDRLLGRMAAPNG
jgi:hypothetical protein